MYIISGCLLGHNCKYNGGSNRCEAVLEFCRTHKYVTVCPESAHSCRNHARLQSGSATGSLTGRART